MTRSSPVLLAAALALGLAACHSGRGGTDLPGDPDDKQPFARIAEDDLVHFTGTEPFWGGQVSEGVLTYQTPEDTKGQSVEVARFAGRAGVSFTGTLEGQDFALMVTDGECSDGMSDRTYPFTATLKVRGETRGGCAWTETQPFTGPQAP
ncbi:hypothetical protein B2G71_05855 [Novosphingobium sp. PC22D]|uniref:COG3650 family protein n=1 Tax=Novosphingobium sp. PC22D TaxID=1962403 RepID=UPI000BF08A06|nr:hypothetical protein [Novosphingobium sp. PC22D]PEQ13832.1 hypothetical protein B2G71_05855 [Novosphingobium sp. PC22D]